MSTNSLSFYHHPITPPGLVIKGMNGPGVNHLPFPISNLWRLQLVIQKLVPAIQKLIPASQKLLPAIQSCFQKLSAIQMLLVLRAHFCLEKGIALEDLEKGAGRKAGLEEGLEEGGLA